MRLGNSLRDDSYLACQAETIQNTRTTAVGYIGRYLNQKVVVKDVDAELVVCDGVRGAASPSHAISDLLRHSAGDRPFSYGRLFDTSGEVGGNVTAP